MFRIFGTRPRLPNHDLGDKLKNACPGCKGDLILKHYKRWFTLFFIPIFPYSHIDTFYQCVNCNSTFSKSAREALLASTTDKESYEKEVRRLYSTTLVSCMAHIAGIDGHYSAKEDREIIKVKDEFAEFSDDINEAVAKTRASAKPEEIVYATLRKSSQVLSTEAILSIIGFCAKVIKVDGRIDEKEEALMKDYLLICGIPKSKYEEIVNTK
ncbi:MAG: TerB family tellurite resistance protein [Bacteroidota bacterium]|nr:TerB family tellurite resistance protein [Bacteroidota bacterium]